MKRLLALLLVLAALPLPAARRRAAGSGPPDSPAGWLHQYAIPFDGDLAALLPLVATTRVLALGDATHGTHELFASKQRLVPFLAAHGFRTIALEAPYAELAALDAYLLHGTGDPGALLESRRYWFWDAQEVLDLLLWARHENARGLTPPMRIAGVDSTEPYTAKRVVLDYLGRVDSAAAHAAADSYACITPTYRPSDLCRTLVAEVRPLMEAKRTQYASATSASEAEEAIHAARVVEQAERVVATKLAARDEVMAENIAWLAARDGKVLVWGHNEHFGRTPYTLLDPEPVPGAGWYLAQVLGDAYFALGSVLLDGTFLAVDYDSGQGLINVQSMTAPHADDAALRLGVTELDAMIVPLRRPLPDWLSSPTHVRIGASGAPSRERATLDVVVELGKKYDAVLFLRRSTPTQLRHWPAFR